MQDIRQKLADIKGQVEQKVLHPYLLKFIQTPVIDEDKLLLLISIMDQMKIPNNQMKNYCLTTMLIQIALDTHEHITNDMIENEEKERLTCRQLTVLAGDYFSGLYYKLLADTDDITMIKVLAGGIKEINEHKIAVYQKDFDGIDKLMSSIKMIESSLIIKLIDYFQVNVWTELVTNLLLVKRLLDEKERCIQTGNSQLFEVLKKNIFPKNDDNFKELLLEQQKYLLAVCDRYIEFSKGILETAIEKIPNINSLLADRIYAIINHQTSAKTFVEEG